MLQSLSNHGVYVLPCLANKLHSAVSPDHTQITHSFVTPFFNRQPAQPVQPEHRKAKLAKRLDGLLPKRSETHDGKDIKMLVIAGGSATSADELIRQHLIKGHDREVVLIVRDEKDVHNSPAFCGRVQWIVLSKDGYKDKKALERSLECALEGKHLAQIGFTSFAGAAICKGSETLEDINVVPMINTAKAVTKFALRNGIKDVTLLNFTSISVSLVDEECCPDVKARATAERKHLALAKKIKAMHPEILLKAVVFRPGLIKTPWEVGAHFVPWDLEQLANAPLVLIPGSGTQPFFLTSLESLSKVMLNCYDSKEDLCETVEAVSEHCYTYGEIMDVLTNRLGVSPLKLYVPSDLVKTVGTNFPFGRLAGYSGYVLEISDYEKIPTISTKRFHELGGEDTSLEEFFPKGLKYVFPTPPYLDHAKDALSRIEKKPELAITFLSSVVKSVPHIVLHTATQTPPAKQQGISPFAKKPS